MALASAQKRPKQSEEFVRQGVTKNVSVHVPMALTGRPECHAQWHIL